MKNRSPRLKELFTVTADRVLFTVTQVCSKLLQILYTFSFCRKLDRLGRQDFEKAFNYIANS